MPCRRVGRGRRYAVTVVAIGLTYAVTIALERVVPYFVGDLFYLVLGAISWWLGADAALLGLALSFVAVASLTPETPFPSIDDVVYLALFVLTALAMVNLGRLAERQAREASEANVAKDRFLDLVSHDLRGPLQAMRLWVKLLRLHPGDVRTVERACDAIDTAGRQQARLVADLLDAARLRSGKLDLHLEPTDLELIVTQTLETIAPEATGKGLALAAPEGPLATCVLADPDRLTQVMWNLLSNAVKFTDAGGEVAVVVERRPQDVRIHVRDTGRGLSAEECRQAFQPYWQRERGVGLGLGLLIARRLVELHGGALSVTSPGLGAGADFAISLPVAGPTDPGAAHAA
jgi:signal transduction histidine kinase